MMTGLLRPDGGQVLINGLDVWSDPCAAKAAIGVVPAGEAASTGSAAWNCWSTRQAARPARRRARERAGQLLGVLDLTADGGRLVADYSTGIGRRPRSAVP